jgi:hypothetical protein
MHLNMVEFFRENPKATYQQATEYRQSIERPHVLGMVAASLRPSGNYKSVADVQSAFKSGALKRDAAEKILREQFGLKD